MITRRVCRAPEGNAPPVPLVAGGPGEWRDNAPRLQVCRNLYPGSLLRAGMSRFACVRAYAHVARAGRGNGGGHGDRGDAYAGSYGDGDRNRDRNRSSNTGDTSICARAHANGGAPGY